MAWSPQQEDALRNVSHWLKNPNGPQVFRLFGFAGTGKTTLAQEFARSVAGRVLYGAYTGKAALVLKSKGCLGASTIHSMIYKSGDMKTREPVFTLNPESVLNGAALLILDEASMISEELALDLLSFGTRVLVLGDPAQLPPVKGEGFFTNPEIAPEIMLTEVHRQAAENPIIRMSMEIREGRRLDLGQYGLSKVIRSRDIDRDEVRSADQILVGVNRTRHSYNARMRELKGYPEGVPRQGDKLVCLKNDKEKGLLNGGIWTVARPPSMIGKYHRMVVTPEGGGERVNVSVRDEFFKGTDGDLDWREKRGSDQFTFGYALTVHKSQGSQWDNVYLFDESRSFREHAPRWLYTGITRAADRVTVVV